MSHITLRQSRMQHIYRSHTRYMRHQPPHRPPWPASSSLFLYYGTVTAASATLYSAHFTYINQTGDVLYFSFRSVSVCTTRNLTVDPRTRSGKGLDTQSKRRKRAKLSPEDKDQANAERRVKRRFDKDSASRRTLLDAGRGRVLESMRYELI